MSQEDDRLASPIAHGSSAISIVPSDDSAPIISRKRFNKVKRICLLLPLIVFGVVGLSNYYYWFYIIKIAQLPSDEYSVVQKLNISSGHNDQSHGLTTSTKTDQNDRLYAPTNTHNHTYPRYLVIIKSSRVGSTFVKDTFKTHYESSIFIRWEGHAEEARAHFDNCGQYADRDHGGKWVCTAHMNDMFRTQALFDSLVNLIQDFNASVVIQMRANAVEKGISMSKRWGTMKRAGYNKMLAARDVKERALGTLKFTRTLAHAYRHGLIPAPTYRDRPTWLWYEDLVRSCEQKFAELFHLIGMDHLPSPPNCDELKFRDDGPYGPYLIKAISQVPALVPMTDHFKFNREVDTDAYRIGFEKETENITHVILGSFR